MAIRETEPGDEELKAPEALVVALGELHRERIFVPEAVDAAILRRTRRRLSRWPTGWWAAAAALVAAGWFGWMELGSRGRSPHQDVNGDGRVDMRDALVLARRVANGEASRQWDFNRDGVIDQRDAEAVARHAVRVGNGGAS